MTWININDRAPEDGDYVFGYFAVFDSVEIYKYTDLSKTQYADHGAHQFSNSTGFLTDDIIYWMPRPAQGGKVKVTDHCRKRLHERLGLNGTKKRNGDKMLAEVSRQISQLEYVVELAKPRLIMGGIRYGGADYDGDNEGVPPVLDRMQFKIDEYKRTGNYEFLVDLFNYVSIEGVLQTHPNFHFDPQDRD